MYHFNTGYWRWISIPFTAVYFVELALVICRVDSETLIQKKKLYILEMVCQIVSVIAYYKIYI